MTLALILNTPAVELLKCILSVRLNSIIAVVVPACETESVLITSAKEWASFNVILFPSISMVTLLMYILSY